METTKPEKTTTETTPSPTGTEARPMLSSISTARIETLTDGVFAIVMTILVFNFHVPAQELVAQHGLLNALASQTPTLLGYAITFVILGVLWVGHHNQFFYIHRADRVLLWINIFFMMSVALLPFSAELFSEYGQDQTAIVIYNLNLILAEIMLFIHWWYATRDSHLLNHIIDPQTRRTVSQRILTPPLFYLIAIGISIISVDMSIFIDILVPIIYVLPSRLDQLFRRG